MVKRSKSQFHRPPPKSPGPLTKAYVQMVGRTAYFWGWPLVYVYNQRTTLSKAPEPILLNGVLPLAPMNGVMMLTGYISPAERYIGDPNQDVVYGLGYLSRSRARRRPSARFGRPLLDPAGL